MKPLILVLFLVLTASLAWAQPIYKVVDENGNVTYTDQKPTDDAEPLDLPELNVLDSRAAEPPISRNTEGAGVEPLRLDIVSPENEENIFGTGNELFVSLASNIEIPLSALIVWYLDGDAQEPIQSMSHTFDFVPRGAHTLRAELQTSAGRVLAETDEITFFMRQASRLNSPPP